MARILVCLPVYKAHDLERFRKTEKRLPLPLGLTHPATEAAFYRTVEVLKNEGHQLGIAWQYGCGQIDQVRAHLFGQYLKARDAVRFDYLWLLDADIAWQPEDVLRILGHHRGVVGATYPLKNEDGRVRGCHAGRFLAGEKIRGDGLLKVQYLAGGFIFLKDSVVQALIDSYPDRRFLINPPAEQIPTYALWTPFLVDRPGWDHIEPGARENLSEDYAFCERLAAIGYDRWLDTRVHLQHWDAERNYMLPEEELAA